MLHPHTEVRFINDKIGHGVVATQLIPRGTITWVQDELDTVYDQQEFARMSPFIRTYLDRYGYRNKMGERVLCWDNGKYVNHSFSPSCFATAYGFEIAIRDIHPGEELTDDYGYLNVSEPFHPLDEGTARKVVYPNDILTYHKEWDELIRRNIPYVFKCRQPLLAFVPKRAWQEFSNLEKSTSGMRSIREEHFDDSHIRMKLR